MDELLKRLRELAWNQYATISQYIEMMRQIIEAERIAKESVNSTKYGGRFY